MPVMSTVSDEPVPLTRRARIALSSAVLVNGVSEFTWHTPKIFAVDEKASASLRLAIEPPLPMTTTSPSEKLSVSTPETVSLPSSSVMTVRTLPELEIGKTFASA